jgi:large conductance mechanosensitive channel
VWLTGCRGTPQSSTERKRTMSEPTSPTSLPRSPAKQAFSLLDEFKNFAFKGNVVDLAVGVIIGVAFGKIVDSLVKHLIMPLIGIIMPGEQGYLAWKWIINGNEVPYGLFLGEVLNFVIVAAVLFVFIVKFLGWIMKSKREEAAAVPPPPTKDQELLAEIRDLLKTQA